MIRADVLKCFVVVPMVYFVILVFFGTKEIADELLFVPFYITYYRLLVHPWTFLMMIYSPFLVPLVFLRILVEITHNVLQKPPYTTIESIVILMALYACVDSSLSYGLVCGQMWVLGCYYAAHVVPFLSFIPIEEKKK